MLQRLCGRVFTIVKSNLKDSRNGRNLVAQITRLCLKQLILSRLYCCAWMLFISHSLNRRQKERLEEATFLSASPCGYMSSHTTVSSNAVWISVVMLWPERQVEENVNMAALLKGVFVSNWFTRKCNSCWCPCKSSHTIFHIAQMKRKWENY